jgi:TonB family protein
MPRASLLALLTSLVPLLAFAQPNPVAPPTSSADAGTGVLTRPPALLKQVEAAFPAEAADAGVGGTVVMEVDIGADGKVTEARVTRSAGAAFDEAALAAVKQFEFSPAQVDGQDAPVRILYSYEFLFRPQTVPVATSGETVNFSGLLLESGTRDPLAGATVVVQAEGGTLETTSAVDGRFELKNVPPGEWTLTVNAPDHARFETTEKFLEGARTEVRYFVRKTVYSQYETVVRGERDRKEVAQVTLRQEEIRLIPGTQGDALKVIQNLPGVARSPFSLGLLVVRGGKPWDTRVYIDDTLVPLLFHFGGLYATFNSNLLEDISFLPGNFSTEYGRNIGGLVKAKTRQPSPKGLHGYLDLNVIDASILLEGPLSESWSIAASARRSYIDIVLPWAIRTFSSQPDALTFTVAPRYYDFQLKVEHRQPASRDRFSITLFGSDDRISLLLPNPTLDPEGRGDFATVMSYLRLAVRWETWLSEQAKFTSHTAVGLDGFTFGLGQDLFFRGSGYPVMTRQKLDLEYPAQRLNLSLGVDLLVLPYRYDAQGPPLFKLNQIPDPFLSRRLLREDAVTVFTEPALFIEAVWNPVDRLKIVPGIRADYDLFMKDGWVDPRLSVFYRVGETWTLKGGAGLFHQPPDYRQGQLSPVFGNPDLLPEASAHYSVGVEKQLTDALSVDLQVYYKSLFHQSRTTLAPPVNSDPATAERDLQFVSDGVGRSAGVELLIRHQLTKNFFGWISYSLSRAERYYALNEKFGLHPLDQPHNLIAVGSYKLPLDFILGARIRYASGALSTPYVGAIYDANGNYYFPLLGDLYSRRLPPFFALDVRIDKRFVFDQWMLALYLDVQNATNHGNVEGVAYNFDYTQEQYLYGLPILPALGIRGEF